jgi:hypothetical protein
VKKVEVSWTNSAYWVVLRAEKVDNEKMCTQHIVNPGGIRPCVWVLFALANPPIELVLNVCVLEER